eukprot:TRINITY_DN26490_c0_g1_i1.p1 TRINITY_DN26490_c0_g1~~TRINITY_DN26490_c0_g1_i1.p1  ORF type:complete len:258 (+),score=51.22 TRINITY_DN26490_c0_g1_i1:154-927(+)
MSFSRTVQHALSSLLVLSSSCCVSTAAPTTTSKPREPLGIQCDWSLPLASSAPLDDAEYRARLWKKLTGAYASSSRKARREADDFDYGDTVGGITVPHEIRTSPGRGRGVFVTAPVKSGTVVWKDSSTARFRNRRQLEKFLRIVKTKLPEVVCAIMHWLYAEYARDGKLQMAFALDDGSFVNNAGRGEKHNIGCASEDLLSEECDDSVALLDLSAGAELLDDYSTYNGRLKWFEDLVNDMSANGSQFYKFWSEREEL